MFDQESLNIIGQLAADLGVEPAALMAIVEVESGGRLYAKVQGRNEPLIRFEGHYFDRLLPASARPKARKLGLASPKAGKIRNPARQSDRWNLLNRAIGINRLAALSSCSWGVGQVMGAHWKWLDYGSVDALVAEARPGGAGQIVLMVRYIDKAGLLAALRARDWATFARLYNGPAYARYAYDKKMAAAYQKHATKRAKTKELGSPLLPPSPVAKTGKQEDSSQCTDGKSLGLRAIRVCLLSIFKRFA